MKLGVRTDENTEKDKLPSLFIRQSDKRGEKMAC